MSNIQIFSNPLFGEVRTGGTKDEPLFCATDVARALGYSNPAKAVIDHCKGVTILETPTKGGVQPIKFIKEPEVYRLVFKSTAPNAEQFNSWLAEDVIPTIRKTGGYIAFNQNMTDEEIMARAIMVAQSTIKKREEEIRLLAEQNNQLALENQQLKKDHDYFDKILSSKATMTTTQIAQDYGMSAKAFNKILKDLHIQYKINKQWILYAPYISQGYVQSRTINITRSNGTPDTVLNTEWTQKGRIFLYNKLKDNNIIPLIEQ